MINIIFIDAFATYIDVCIIIHWTTIQIFLRIKLYICNIRKLCPIPAFDPPNLLYTIGSCLTYVAKLGRTWHVVLFNTIFTIELFDE